MSRKNNKIENSIISNSHNYTKLKLLASIISSLIILIPSVMAHCPLCTGATIAGVGLTRALGWDDSIVGVFVGAMIISTALWADKLLKKRNIAGGNDKLRITGLIIITILLTLITFYYAGLFGIGNNYRIFGIERILFGTISGGVVSLASFLISNEIKKKNNGKAKFSYQTIIITFAALILNALLFWAIF